MLFMPPLGRAAARPIALRGQVVTRDSTVSGGETLVSVGAPIGSGPGDALLSFNLWSENVQASGSGALVFTDPAPWTLMERTQTEPPSGALTAPSLPFRSTYFSVPTSPLSPPFAASWSGLGKTISAMVVFRNVSRLENRNFSSGNLTTTATVATGLTVTRPGLLVFMVGQIVGNWDRPLRRELDAPPAGMTEILNEQGDGHDPGLFIWTQPVDVGHVSKEATFKLRPGAPDESDRAIRWLFVLS